MTMEATGELFIIKGEDFEGKARWNVFKKFVETKNIFIIYEGENMLRIIPKRAFMNNEELAEFRMILQENVNSNN